MAFHAEARFLIDVQQLVADLTEPQQEAVRHVDGPLLIIAGAGSGKTRVLTRRVAHLVSQGIPAASILAITFTNKAAGEMKQRTEKLHSFADLSAVEEALDRLTSRELGRWLERRPGQKEARYTHLLEGDLSENAEPTDSDPPTRQTEPDDLAGEVARLRQELDAVRRDVDALREQLNR